MLKTGVVCVLLSLGLSAAALADDPGKFSETGLEGWDAKSFEGRTDYDITKELQLDVLRR